MKSLSSPHRNGVVSKAPSLPPTIAIPAQLQPRWGALVADFNGATAQVEKAQLVAEAAGLRLSDFVGTVLALANIPDDLNDRYQLDLSPTAKELRLKPVETPEQGTPTEPALTPADEAEMLAAWHDEQATAN